MALTAAQLHQLRSALFETPLLLGDEAHRSVQATYELIVAGTIPVDVQQRFRGDSESPNKMKVVGNVAVIPLMGMLAPTMTFAMEIFGGTSTEDFLGQVKAAMGDPNIKGIIIYADSPGGAAMGTYETANALYAMRGQKPMATFVKGYCASACYFIAAAAGPIYTTPTSISGSIGAKYVHTEVSKMRAEMGVTDTVLTNETSKLKAAGDRYQPLADPHKDMLQRFVNASGDQFIQAVATYRETSVDLVNKSYGGGEMFFGEDAFKRGMIDAVTPDLAAAIALLLPGQQTTAAVFSQSTTFSKEGSPVNPKLKALLFAQGLTESVDAADNLCQLAINAFFAGVGQAAPKEDVALMAAICGPRNVIKPGPVQTLLTEEVHLTAPQALDFRKDLVASARILNQKGADISEAMIDQAMDEGIKKGITQDAIAARWLKNLDGKEPPVTRIDVKENGMELFAEQAAEGYFIGMCLKAERHEDLGRELKAKAKPEVLNFARAPMHHLARQCLEARGVRIDRYASNEEVVALAMKGIAQERYDVPTELDVRSEAPSANLPGDFPNLLSNLVGKVLDRTIQLAEPTYDQWTGTWPNDLPDFKAAPIVARSEPNMMSRILNAEETKQLQLGEELLGYMFLEEYGNKIGLTPVLVANDDLGAFMEDAINLQDAWERTIDYRCVEIVVNNEQMLDGHNLFDDTYHFNDIAGGSGSHPGQAAANTMNLKFRAQRGVGNVGRSSARFQVALIAPRYEVEADQAWAPLGQGQVQDNKLAAVDSNLNTFRGKIRSVVSPILQDFTDTTWYGLSDPATKPAVRRAYFRGYGRNGKRQRWYDPGTRTIWIDLVGRVGVAATNWRYIVRNPGS